MASNWLGKVQKLLPQPHKLSPTCPYAIKCPHNPLKYSKLPQGVLIPWEEGGKKVLLMPKWPNCIQAIKNLLCILTSSDSLWENQWESWLETLTVLSFHVLIVLIYCVCNSVAPFYFAFDEELWFYCGFPLVCMTI